MSAFELILSLAQSKPFYYYQCFMTPIFSDITIPTFKIQLETVAWLASLSSNQTDRKKCLILHHSQSLKLTEVSRHILF